MASPSDTRRSLFKRFKFLWLILLGAGLFFFTMFAPVSWCEKISDTHWELKGAYLLEDQQQDVLLVHLYSQGRGRGGRSFTRFMTFDPADGRELGVRLTDSNTKCLRVNHMLLWLREFGLGVIRDKRDFALSLPDLKLVHDLPTILEEKGVTKEATQQVVVDEQSGLVYILTLEQSWWIYDPLKRELSERGDKPLPFTRAVWERKSCPSAPKPPPALGEDLLLDASFVCDGRRGELLDLGGGDRLLAHQTLQDENGKLILSRLEPTGQKVWSLHEKDWHGQVRGMEKRGFRVEWSTWYQGQVILAVPEEDGQGDFYLLAIQPDSGKIVWQQHYQ